MTFQKATNTPDSVKACDPFPLPEPGDPRYVDLSVPYGFCLGGRNILLESFKLEPDGEPAFHMLLAGPGGSGKSTLVLQSFEEFREMGLYPVHIDVLDALDPSSISYSDLLLTLIVQVDAQLENEGIRISDVSRKDVEEWFTEQVLSQESCKQLGLEVKTGIEGSTGFPFVGKLIAKATAAFKVGSTYRKEIRQSIDRRPYELIDKVNVYLDAATTAIQKKNKHKEILVYFDNLEKINNASEQVDDALINKASLIKKVRCKCLYTIPFALLQNPGQSGLVSDAFDVKVVPMIPLRSRDDSQDVLNTAKSAVLRQILKRRIEINLVFDSEQLLDRIILASGGCPRDLIKLTKLACQYAGDEKVTDSHIDNALQKGRTEHLRPIKGSDFSIIAKVHLTKNIENTEDEMRLILHRMLLHYNEVDWYDAHPLVQMDDRFKKALSNLTESQQ